MRIAINGLGRIGRLFLRRARTLGVEVAAINDLAPTDQLAYLVRYDSAHGRYPGRVESAEGRLVLDGTPITVLSERDPAKLPWGALGVDVVAECTGVFRDRKALGGHIQAGARRVVVSAPVKDPDVTIVMGVNEDRFDPASHHIVSNASCTTNCLAPVAKVLHDAFGIERGLLTTVHAYTSSQALVDGPARKYRRGRAAAANMVPTSTGAARATALVLPELEGRLDGTALRVPILTGSIVDFTFTSARDLTAAAVNDALRAAAATERLRGILSVAEDEIVSSDVVGDTHSSIVDATSTMSLGSRMAKVFSWYDNEAGYSARLVDAVRWVGRG